MEIGCSYGLILTKMDFHKLYSQVVSIKKMSLQTPNLVFSSMSSPYSPTGCSRTRMVTKHEILNFRFSCAHLLSTGIENTAAMPGSGNHTQSSRIWRKHYSPAELHSQPLTLVLFFLSNTISMAFIETILTYFHIYYKQWFDY